MQFFWRSDGGALASCSFWVDELDDKNRKAGTSAPTLDAAWSGPLDLLGALATQWLSSWVRSDGFLGGLRLLGDGSSEQLVRLSLDADDDGFTAGGCGAKHEVVVTHVAPVDIEA